MAKFSILFFLVACFYIAFTSSCANIIPPGGGPRDSLPPKLLSAVPKDSALNAVPNRVILYFDEFVEIQNAQENVVVSPLPNNTPQIDYKLRTVTIRLRDTLEQNTTYSINFGNAIKDVNEGNVLRNFIYVFSTGSTIDSNTLTGKVVLAETGKLDTTLIVVLHRNLADSAVAKEKPRYLSKLDGGGNFLFQNLPAGTFALYAIPNEYARKYEDSTNLFAFADSSLSTTANNKPVMLYAYNYPKTEKQSTATSTGRRALPGSASQDKILRFTTSLDAGGKHDILKSNIEFVFNRDIFKFDSNSVILTNKDFVALPDYHFTIDTSGNKFFLNYAWQAGQEYSVLISKDAFSDSAGISLTRNDTVRISTKTSEDYGSVKVRFKNLDLSKNPVLLLIQNEKIVESIPLLQREWNRKLFPPGEYEMRILFDTNKNGRWDAGKFFGEKRQPEIVRDLKIPLTIRGNWDNEKDISL